jgi:hypothetical protein
MMAKKKLSDKEYVAAVMKRAKRELGGNASASEVAAYAAKKKWVHSGNAAVKAFVASGSKPEKKRPPVKKRPSGPTGRKSPTKKKVTTSGASQRKSISAVNKKAAPEPKKKRPSGPTGRGTEISSIRARNAARTAASEKSRLLAAKKRADARKSTSNKSPSALQKAAKKFADRGTAAVKKAVGNRASVSKKTRKKTRVARR